MMDNSALDGIYTFPHNMRNFLKRKKFCNLENKFEYLNDVELTLNPKSNIGFLIGCQNYDTAVWKKNDFQF